MRIIKGPSQEPSAKLGIQSFARTPGASGLFSMYGNLFDVSSFFWLFFQANLILINPV